MAMRHREIQTEEEKRGDRMTYKSILIDLELICNCKKRKKSAQVLQHRSGFPAFCHQQASSHWLRRWHIDPSNLTQKEIDVGTKNYESDERVLTQCHAQTDVRVLDHLSKLLETNFSVPVFIGFHYSLVHNLL